MASPKKRRRRRNAGRGEANIATLIEKVYPSREPDEQRLLRITALWQRVTTPRLRANVRPAAIGRGGLTLHASSSAWAQEASLLLPRILPRLSEHVAGIDPSRVRVRVGPLPPAPPEPQPRPPKVAPLRPGEIPEAVASAIAKLPDDDVRDAVLKAAMQSLAHLRR